MNGNLSSSEYVDIIQRLVRIEEGQKQVVALAVKVSDHEDKIDELNKTKDRVIVTLGVLGACVAPTLGGTSWVSILTKLVTF